MWVDEKEMHGPIVHVMTKAIDNSKAVLVFLTQQYIAKVSYSFCTYTKDIA